MLYLSFNRQGFRFCPFRSEISGIDNNARYLTWASGLLSVVRPLQRGFNEQYNPKAIHLNTANVDYIRVHLDPDVFSEYGPVEEVGLDDETVGIIVEAVVVACTKK